MSLVGFINLLKPPSMTSAQAVAFVRRRLPGRLKVGHLGTLDPPAVGVLPLAVGAATRLIPFLPEARKAYRAEVLLGYTSDTLDLAGQVVSSGVTPDFERAAIERALLPFQGTIMQTPPRVSAIRVGGRRSYDRARQGEDFELDARPTTYHQVRLVEVDGPKLVIDIECGTGTYIRSLVRDLGESLGCGAVLAFLIRTRSGPFHLPQAVTLEEIQEAALQEAWETVLLPCGEVLSELPRCPDVGQSFQKGLELRVTPPEGLGEGELVLVGDTLGRLVHPDGLVKALARAPKGLRL
ncbi:MAG: tRNA pseudouridine(55) synthase TruB [Candidatus Eremiobacteraeota bacterium]|nr:tRNA pseudouridine(55) synthase TruB [Candidatus Eremiobacteraeota bacterium]